MFNNFWCIGAYNSCNPIYAMAVLMITRAEVLMGRDAAYPLSPEQEANLAKLLHALNQFRAQYGLPMKVSSGYRPAGFNAAAGGAKNSAHMTCEACDFSDQDGALDAWCLNNLGVLEACGLYLEDPVYTKGWCHLAVRKPKSGKRVFKP